MNIQWFPGHMSKSLKLINSNLKYIDLVVELRDARIPQSSSNPLLLDIAKEKTRLIIFTKSDLADRSVSALWEKYYANNPQYAHINFLFTDLNIKHDVNRIRKFLLDFKDKKVKAKAHKGVVDGVVRIIILGIPNVGKSTLINRISNKNAAKTQDRPGVTVGKQWVRLLDGIQMLDTPGVLWPKFSNDFVAYNIAFTGGITDRILDSIELASTLIWQLRTLYPTFLDTRYKINSHDYDTKSDLLLAMGKKRGCLASGGEIDFERISNIVLDEFREGTIGRISLETPSEIELINKVDLKDNSKDKSKDKSK